MMRAIRDNEEAASAMGKNVVKQHLFIFILGSAIVGIAQYDDDCNVASGRTSTHNKQGVK